MHQVVGSHDCDGARSDHEPLEDIRVELPPLAAAVIQALHCVTQQGLVLVKRGGHTTVVEKCYRVICFELHF